MRGLRKAALCRNLNHRYNPACAGTTATPMRAVSGTTIQPRVCGDYLELPFAFEELHDTTPRVRGLLQVSRICHFSLRYNPACAGTTHHGHGTAAMSSIQPRVCGDYHNLLYSSSVVGDTTPRVRGLLGIGQVYRRSLRYNPACAGTTSRHSAFCGVPPIQPRVCGDYEMGLPPHFLAHDTTPRVRGLQAIYIPRCLQCRYNPACAGTTPLWTNVAVAISIQPRVCGDYTKESLALEPFYHN